MTSSRVNKILDLNPHFWKECAGKSAEILKKDSRVYYFPQGHAEQAYSSPDFSSVGGVKSYVICRVLSIRFLANPDTDEVFSKIRLQPLDRFREGILRTGLDRVTEGDDDENEEEVFSFVKVLTSSDANNGGGFSVPKYCADSIFPTLNYKIDPPMQKIFVQDVHGFVWDFRHIFRGTPRRHLLTTGWSKFVNNKKLIQGDSVVFVKNEKREISVGIRRTSRTSMSYCGRWNNQIPRVKLEEELKCEERFSRSGRGKVSAESVLEAVDLAGADEPFEIVYYPREGSWDFVVKADKVEKSLNIFWSAGMRVKIAMEAEDSTKLTWFQGTVSATVIPDHGPWQHSPWRMLEVNWDEPEVLQNLKRVSPWQVELISTTSSIQAPFPLTKKLRGPENSEWLTEGQGALYFPMARLPNSTVGVGHLNPSLFSCNTFPAGMQGARHDTISVPNISKSVSNYNTHHMFPDHLYGTNMLPNLSSASIELNIGGTSQSDISSLHSQGNVHSFGTEMRSNQNFNAVKKVGGGSFQLFGKIIHISPPVESGVENGGAGCKEDDGGKSCKETEGVTNPLNPSLYYPYKKRLDKRDVHCPRVSALEACSL